MKGIQTEGRGQLAGFYKTGHVEQAYERLVRDGGVVEFDAIGSVEYVLHGGDHGRYHGPESN